MIFLQVITILLLLAVLVRRDRPQQLLWSLNRKVGRMADKFDVLTEEVAENSSVVQSAVTLLDGLVAQLTEAQNDPAQIAEIVANLKSQRTALAEAVAKNTPASPEPPVV